MKTCFNIRYELDPAAVLDHIAAQAASASPGYICVADGNVLQKVHRDPEYRKVVDGAMFSICDSSWAAMIISRLYGTEVPQYCGSQIFMDIVSMRRYRQCFLGTSQETLDALKERLSTIDPAVSEMPFKELPFCAVEDFDYEAIGRYVNEQQPDIIWVALGAPKQEMFMNRLLPHLEKGVMLGVGAVFNFYSGAGEKRAPSWMVRSHLEWLYRIFQSPRKQLARCWRIATAYPSIIREEKKKSR